MSGARGVLIWVAASSSLFVCDSRRMLLHSSKEQRWSTRRSGIVSIRGKRWSGARVAMLYEKTSSPHYILAHVSRNLPVPALKVLVDAEPSFNVRRHRPLSMCVGTLENERELPKAAMHDLSTRTVDLPQKRWSTCCVVACSA